MVNTQNKTKRNRIIVGLVFLIVGIIAMTLFFNKSAQSLPSEPAVISNQAGASPGTIKADANLDTIKIPLSAITSKAMFSSANIDGVDIQYIIVKAEDGSIRTAMNACDVCYQNHKGYRQVGNELVCNNCGKSFSINQIGTENRGRGCWPSYLPSKIEGDFLVISKADLKKKSYMFA